MNIEIIGDVVTVIAQWRRIKRQKPDRSNPEFLKIIELLDQPAKIAHPIAIAVMERLDMQLVNDGVFVPKRISGNFAWRFHGLTLRTNCSAQSLPLTVQSRH